MIRHRDMTYRPMPDYPIVVELTGLLSSTRGNYQPVEERHQRLG